MKIIATFIFKSSVNIVENLIIIKNQKKMIQFRSRRHETNILFTLYINVNCTRNLPTKYISFHVNVLLPFVKFRETYYENIK